MDHPKDHSLFGLGLPGYTLQYFYSNCLTLSRLFVGVSEGNWRRVFFFFSGQTRSRQRIEENTGEVRN